MSADHLPGGEARPAPQQLRLCVTQEINPDSPALNHALLLRPGPDADAALFREAIEALAARHDALRGRFRRGGPDGWTVHPGPPARSESNVTLLTDQDLADRAQQEVDRPFDLAREPPLRVHWWHLGSAIACQLTFHHIATDARTVDLLLDELERHDHARTTPADAVSYYSLAARAWARQADTNFPDRLGRYVEQLAESDINSSFVPAPAGPREAIAASWHVPAEVAQAVRAHAASLGCTRFAVWLTAWTRAVTKAFDCPIAPVAVPVSSRLSGAELATVGFFVNLVVTPLRHERNEQFAAACRRVSGQVLEALDRRDIPLHELARRLSLSERGLDNPLTALSAQLLPAERRVIHFSGSPVAVTYLESRAPRYRLALEVREQAECPVARVRADKSVIEPARLQAIWQLIERDITGRADNPPRKSRPRAADETPLNRALVAPVHHWIRVRPGEVAVRWADGRWTWREFGDVIGQIIAMLRGNGIRAGDTAVVEMPRGPYMAATLIALLELDAVPVMARAGLSEPARALLALEVGALLRITGPLHARPVPAPREELMRNRRASVPDGTAYVTFTSGSTGLPKGVPAPAQGVRDYLKWVGAAAGIGPRDRCLQVAAVGFDALVRDTLTPLITGATLVMLSDEFRLSGEGMARAISDHDISAVLSLIPAQLRLMASHLKPPVPRVICIAGEPLFRADVRTLSEVAPDCRLLNLYGPTEATMTSTCFDTGTTLDHGDRLPAGHPVASAAVHVLGPDGAELPSGCSGEIIISGPAVAKHYVGSASAPGPRFALRRIGGEDRWSYATGDIGYWLDDEGGLRIEGRRDSEHKVNGERVDLATVEAALRGHPTVIDAAVSIERHGHLDIVCAHVMLSDASVSEGQLRTFLNGTVSNVAIPRRYTFVEQIPRLANGKLDRSRLRSGTASPAVRPTGQRPSWPRVQRAVAEVLGQVPSDAEATLFGLGADSLAVIEVLERLGVLRTAPEQAIRVFRDSRLATLTGLLDSCGQPDPTRAGNSLGALVSLDDTAPRPGAPTVIFFPPAGGDLVSFAPAAEILGDSARLVVARRPEANGRPASAAAWVDAHVAQVARYASALPPPVLLCGYSVGFLIARLTCCALALNHSREIHSMIGINPSPMEAGLGTTEVATSERRDEMAYRDTARARFRADMDIRSVRQRAEVSLPQLLLLQSPDDRLSWDLHAKHFALAFRKVHRKAITGSHVLTIDEMRHAGKLMSQWIAGMETDGGCL